MKMLDFTIAKEMHRFTEPGNGCNWRWMVLTYGIMRANVRNRFYVTQENIAKDIGTSDRTVRSVLEWLIEHGAVILVDAEQRMGPESLIPADCNVYELTGVIAFEDVTLTYLYGEDIRPEAHFLSDRKPASANLYTESTNNNSAVGKPATPSSLPRGLRIKAAAVADGDPDKKTDKVRFDSLDSSHPATLIATVLKDLNGVSAGTISDKQLTLLKEAIKTSTGDEIPSITDLCNKYPVEMRRFVTEWVKETFERVSIPRTVQKVIEMVRSSERPFGLIHFFQSEVGITMGSRPVVSASPAPEPDYQIKNTDSDIPLLEFDE